MKINSCRVCSSEALQRVVNLGKHRVVDFPASAKTEKPIVPLELMLCTNCGLVQLSQSVNPEILFSEFWYRSGTNEMMKDALHDIVIKSADKVALRVGEVVCDIGCNDGTMLSMYPIGVITVGFDPANIIDEDASRKRMSYAIHNYFNKQEALMIVQKTGKPFKIITAIAMFYDLNDPADFLNDVKTVLHDQGMLVIQMNYLLRMLKQNSFDNICHEHLTYFSLTSLRFLLNHCGLEVVDVETNDVNGGSLRVYIKKMPISKADVEGGAYDRVKDLLEEEKDYGLKDPKTYHEFGWRINSILIALQKYLVHVTLKSPLSPIYAYGASTRGTTLLQSVKLPLAGVAERDHNKFGRFMVADWLQIWPEDYVRSRCKYMLVLPYHFERGIVEREKDWLNDGGTLIFPMGGDAHMPHLVTKDGTTQLLDELVRLKIQ